MIKTMHTQWARAVFTPVIEGLLRTSFSSFYSTASVPEIDPASGLLILPNHFSWWDGFFMYHLLFPMSNRKVHLMMLERQLRRYWYFRHIGAFSINPGAAASVIESLEYTAGILNDSSRLAIIYPQGEIQSQFSRSIKLYPGFASALKKTEKPVTVLPVFFAVDWFEHKKPEIWFRYGTPFSKEEVLGDLSGFFRTFNRGFTELKNSIISRDFMTDCFRERDRKLWSINAQN